MVVYEGVLDGQYYCDQVEEEVDVVDMGSCVVVVLDCEQVDQVWNDGDQQVEGDQLGGGFVLYYFGVVEVDCVEDQGIDEEVEGYWV